MAYGADDRLDTPPVTDWVNDWDWLDDGWGENAIVSMVTNGKVNQMPAQAGKLTDAQLHVLAAYVWGLSNNPAKAAAP